MKAQYAIFAPLIGSEVDANRRGVSVQHNRRQDSQRAGEKRYVSRGRGSRIIGAGEVGVYLEYRITFVLHLD